MLIGGEAGDEESSMRRWESRRGGRGEGGRCNRHPAQSPALGKTGDRKSTSSWQPGTID